MGQVVALTAILTLSSVLRRPKPRFELPKPALPKIVRKRLK